MLKPPPRRWLLLAAFLLAVATPVLLRFLPREPSAAQRARDLPPAARTHEDPRPGARELEAAFAERRSNLWVETTGEVVRLLPEDRKGNPHQRFLVRVSGGPGGPGGPTVLVSHNIAIAPRVPVAVGSEVRFRGEYEWNAKGGVVHWTHHDPDGSTAGGWIEHNGRRYR